MELFSELSVSIMASCDAQLVEHILKMIPKIDIPINNNRIDPYTRTMRMAIDALKEETGKEGPFPIDEVTERMGRGDLRID